MSEVILPCPNPKCGSNVPIVQEGTRIDIFCPSCRLTLFAPIGSLEWLIDQWNALPRAPRWTHEPPKVEGWYWRKDITTKDTIHICKIFYVDDASLFPPSEWAGPIPAPID